MPIVLLAIIGAIFLLDGVIPYGVKAHLFAVSLFVKSIIVFTLPFIIFMLLFKTVSKLSSDATRIVLLILGGVCCSNFVSTMVSYLVGSSIYHMDLSVAVPQGTSGLTPAWSAVAKGGLGRLPVLPGISQLILLVDNDENGEGQRAAE